jgi:hypothetical protein
MSMGIKIEGSIEIVKANMFKNDSALGGCVSFEAESDFMRDHSASCSLQTSSFLPMPKEGEKWLIVGDTFFLVTEVGTEGFNTKLVVYRGALEKAADTVIHFTLASEEEFKSAEATFQKTEDSLASLFATKAAFEEATSGGQFGRVTKSCSETPFLKVETGLTKHLLSFSEGKPSRLKSDTAITETGRKLKSSEVGIGSLVLESKNSVRDWFQISKVVGIAHDINAKFYALAEVVHTYPADAEEIAKAYPALAKEGLSSSAQDKTKARENRIMMPRVSSGKLGDKVICQKIDDSFKDSAIKPGIFNFAVYEENPLFREGEYTACGDFQNGDERLIRLFSNATVCACVDVGGQYNIIFYDFKKYIECDGGLYASFEYKGNYGFFTPGTEEETRPAVVNILYAYMYRGLVEPVKLTTQEYKAWPVNQTE